ncbi:MAG: hypothetical protein D3910_28405 [Candidatus Electrothrix sp. ATG2]|nr:hypothetical protein [Candidatus Electrothrix sp. ATG2]
MRKRGGESVEAEYRINSQILTAQRTVVLDGVKSEDSHMRAIVKKEFVENTFLIAAFFLAWLLCGTSKIASSLSPEFGI